MYDDNIDNIIGMILAKSLIDVLDRPNGVAELFDSVPEPRYPKTGI